MTGRIFSIEEFSTFDGPGIRCTVFLKGCPLSCQWCHNPEGQRFDKEILRSPNGCIGCGTCTATGMTEASIPLCPQHLLRLCGEDITPQALTERLADKLWMLSATGGGVTFSGGEPMRQGDFLLSCLKCLEGKTHRAVQTCGYAPKSIFSQVLENCDYMLYDLKLMDNDLHRRYTGVDNGLILENYQSLAASGLPFITRIPLIPGVNDTAENLTATAEFMASHGVGKIELLPYNRTAGAKYKATGRCYQVDFDQTARPNPREEIFEHYHIEVNVL